jgi:hypothetical protein
MASDAPKFEKAHDLLGLLGAFAHQNGIALNAEDLVPRFLADAGTQLDAALSDRALLHGTRTEHQFEALILTLGRYRLLKSEDQGRIHSTVDCRVPDFRVVLDDGKQWLVEVKNVRREEAGAQVTRLSPAYLASLQSYCDLVGAPLRIAHYWSRWKFWTLVDPERFRTATGGARIEMMAAFQASELSRLGDVIFCTEPPIRLFVETDPAPSNQASTSTGEARTRGVRLFVGGHEITEARSYQLAWILMLYGEWTAEGPRPVMVDGRLAGIEFVIAPEQSGDEDASLLMGAAIGQASRIFARYFAEDTTAENTLVQLRGLPKPEWFEPIAEWNFKDAQLPLWV